jgi:hypothetical protein
VVVPDDCFLLAALESGHRLSQLVERQRSHRHDPDVAEAIVRVHGPETRERSSGPMAPDERVVAKRQAL